MSKKIAVVLAGCGVYDGSEIHEATLSLLALDQAGAKVECFAPNITQMHVINHLNGDVMDESRNVLVEAARIARGEVRALSDYRPENFDGILIPGGFGAAKNLSSFAVDGADCVINKDVEIALSSTRKTGKPIAALCISPAILAKMFEGAKITLGAEGQASEAVVDGMGAEHVVTGNGEIVVDERLNLITSPCYMLEASISQIYEGVQALVKELLARS